MASWSHKFKTLVVTQIFPTPREHGPHHRLKNVVQTFARNGPVSCLLLASNHTSRDQLQAAAELPNVRIVRAQTHPISFPFERLRHEFDPSFLNTHGLKVPKSECDTVLRNLANYDLVWVHTTRVANAFRIWRWPHSVLDFDDIDSAVYASAMRTDTNWISYIKKYRMMLIWQRRERYARRRFSALAVCSPNDREYLGNPPNTHVIRNTVEIETKGRWIFEKAQRRIGFIGALHYAPNRNGLKWFIREVWPAICAEYPDVRLRVIGEGSDEELASLSERIDQLGYVRDTRDEFASWRAMIAPIWEGGGTRVKVAEALGRGCPIVATPLGAFGYDVTSGREICIAQSAGEFREACSRLLCDAAFASMISANGRAIYERDLSVDAVARAICEAANDAMESDFPKRDELMRQIQNG